MSFLIPIIYSAALTYLVWKAFKVMSNGWGAFDKKEKNSFKSNNRQNKYTIHPELLDKSGNITQEELLTVRFSNDSDSTLEEKETKTDYNPTIFDVHNNSTNHGGSEDYRYITFMRINSVSCYQTTFQKFVRFKS